MGAKKFERNNKKWQASPEIVYEYPNDTQNDSNINAPFPCIPTARYPVRPEPLPPSPPFPGVAPPWRRTVARFRCSTTRRCRRGTRRTASRNDDRRRRYETTDPPSIGGGCCGGVSFAWRPSPTPSSSSSSSSSSEAEAARRERRRWRPCRLGRHHRRRIDPAAAAAAAEKKTPCCFRSCEAGRRSGGPRGGVRERHCRWRC